MIDVIDHSLSVVFWLIFIENIHYGENKTKMLQKEPLLQVRKILKNGDISQRFFREDS